MEDSKIIELYQNRDENAIRETDCKYGAYSRSISYNIIDSHEDAEECVNDSYLSVWNTIPPKKPNSLKAYLGRIVRNVSLSRFRKNHARKRDRGAVVLFSELEDCIPAENDVEKALDRIMLGELISNWLDTETEENRCLFVRRYWYGDPYAELNNTFHISEKLLMNRLYQMRIRLKKYLEGNGVSV